MRSREEVDTVLALFRQGANRCAIARATGIPRGTINDWVAGRTPRFAAPSSVAPWEVPGFPLRAYSYLLGLYLGDGCVSEGARTTALRIFFDAKYPGIIGECVRAVRLVRPANRVAVFRRRPTRCVVVQCCSQRWPMLFPQHGPGMKHERRIVLASWQREITGKHPRELIRGLIHSDGCRFINPVRVNGRRYAYTRYLFSNASDDIRGILCAHLDLLGIEWRPVGAREISIARRESVARLDGFVGPKC
jgi:hypothetical protein